MDLLQKAYNKKSVSKLIKKYVIKKAVICFKKKKKKQRKKKSKNTRRVITPLVADPPDATPPLGKIN